MNYIVLVNLKLIHMIVMCMVPLGLGWHLCGVSVQDVCRWAVLCLLLCITVGQPINLNGLPTTSKSHQQSAWTFFFLNAQQMISYHALQCNTLQADSFYVGQWSLRLACNYYVRPEILVTQLGNTLRGQRQQALRVSKYWLLFFFFFFRREDVYEHIPETGHHPAEQ